MKITWLPELRLVQGTQKLRELVLGAALPLVRLRIQELLL
jgi:hypothetical protein